MNTQCIPNGSCTPLPLYRSILPCFLSYHWPLFSTLPLCHLLSLEQNLSSLIIAHFHIFNVCLLILLLTAMSELFCHCKYICHPAIFHVLPLCTAVPLCYHLLTPEHNLSSLIIAHFLAFPESDPEGSFRDLVHFTTIRAWPIGGPGNHFQVCRLFRGHFKVSAIVYWCHMTNNWFYTAEMIFQ